MSIVCVVQARMGSTRLPGKVLAEVGGQPMLGFMLRRLASVPADDLVVATSDLAVDDPIADVAAAAGVAVVRGSEDDVLGRFARVLDHVGADTVIRLTGDCPLLDPGLVAQCLAVHRDRGAAYTSNTLLRTYPDGLDVEVVQARSLLEAHAEATARAEREHVTPFVYRRPRRFPLAALVADEPLGDERWTVDTAADLDRIRGLVDALADPENASWREILTVAGRRATPPPGAMALRPAAAADGDALFAWRNDPDAVRYSRSGSGVSREQHATWLANTIGNPGRRLWIAELDGRPFGHARVDVDDGEGLVSVGLAKDVRGQGRGTELLLHLQRQLQRDMQVLRLRAEVRLDNTASLRAFRRAGFAHAAPDGDFAVLHWGRPDISG